MSAEFNPNGDQQTLLIKLDRTIRDQQAALDELQLERTPDAYFLYELNSQNIRLLISDGADLKIPDFDIVKAIIRGTMPHLRKLMLEHWFLFGEKIEKDESLEIAKQLNIRNFKPLNWWEMPE